MAVRGRLHPPLGPSRKQSAPVLRPGLVPVAGDAGSSAAPRGEEFGSGRPRVARTRILPIRRSPAEAERQERLPAGSIPDRPPPQRSAPQRAAPVGAGAETVGAVPTVEAVAAVRAVEAREVVERQGGPGPRTPRWTAPVEPPEAGEGTAIAGEEVGARSARGVPRAGARAGARAEAGCSPPPGAPEGSPAGERGEGRHDEAGEAAPIPRSVGAGAARKSPRSAQPRGGRRVWMSGRAPPAVAGLCIGGPRWVP
jgi:hypothetical protein